MKRKPFQIRNTVNNFIILSILIALIGTAFIPAVYSSDLLVKTDQENVILDNYNDITSNNVGFNNPTIAQQSVDNQRSDGLWINVTKEIAPSTIHPCEPATIFINVSVEGEPTIDYAPIEVVLVVDRSGSMGNIFDGNTTLTYLKEAAKNFVGELNFSKDRVGVVSFGSQACIEQPLTDNGTAANASIDDIYLRSNSWENGTNTGDALRLAQEHLLGNLSSGAVPVIVLFSDGCPSFHGLSQNINQFTWESYFCYENCPTYNNTCVLWARDHAANAKSNGITIFSVGFFESLCDSCYSPYNCDDVTAYAQWLMKDIATDPSMFFNAPEASDINNVFQNISQEVGEIILTNLTIEDYLPENITVLTTNGGTYTNYMNGTQKVTFTKDTMSLNSTWHTSFNITTEELGYGIITNLDYSRFIYTKNLTQHIQLLPYPVLLDVTNPLTIEKQSLAEVDPGQLFNYTIIVENIGHLVLEQVVIEDMLPDNVSFTPLNMNIYSNYSGFDEDNWQYNAGSHIITIDNISLDVGQSITIVITVVVLEDAEGTLENTAIAGYAEQEGICEAFGISSSTISTDILTGNPNIRIQKYVDPSVTTTNTNVTFLIEVENTGDCPLDQVTVIDELPSGLSYVSDDSGGSENPVGTITWDLGTLAIGDIVDIFMVAHVNNDANGVLVNQVNVTGQSIYGDVFDNACANLTIIYPGINVTKTANPTSSPANSNITFTIVVENTGDCILDPVLVDDYLPNEMSYISDDSGGVEVPGNQVFWNLGSMNPGDIKTITLIAHISAGTTGVLTNIVNATGGLPEGGIVFDWDYANVTILQPGITVEKTASPTSGYPNNDITFTITVENTGELVLNPVKVTDWIPDGLSYISDDSGGVEGPTGTIVWNNIGPMNPSDVVIITLIARIDMNASGVLINHVNATGYDPTGYPVARSDDANVTVIESNMIVEKAVKYNCNGPYNNEGIIIDLDGPNGYDWCTFRINVTNTYDQPANVTIKDVLPDGLTDGNHYKPRAPDDINGNELYWYFDGNENHGPLINPGETISIELRADMGNCSTTYLNHAFVTTSIGDMQPLYDVDNASVEWINCEAEYPIDINQSIYDRGFPIRHALDGDWGAAQNFTPSVNVITSVDLYLRKYANPEFDLTIELREGAVDGTLLDVLVIPKSEINSIWQWYSIDFANSAVMPGMDYYIVLPPAPSNVSNSNGYEWGYGFGDLYLGGCLWFTRDSGILWRDLPTMYDFTFKTYGYV